MHLVYSIVTFLNAIVHLYVILINQKTLESILELLTRFENSPEFDTESIRMIFLVLVHDCKSKVLNLTYTQVS